MAAVTYSWCSSSSSSSCGRGSERGRHSKWHTPTVHSDVPALPALPALPCPACPARSLRATPAVPAVPPCLQCMLCLQCMPCVQCMTCLHAVLTCPARCPDLPCPAVPWVSPYKRRDRTAARLQASDTPGAAGAEAAGATADPETQPAADNIGESSVRPLKRLRRHTSSGRRALTINSDDEAPPATTDSQQSAEDYYASIYHEDL